MTVHIVTDSTCDLPTEYIEQLNITVVPLKVIFGEEVFRDGVDITAGDFYRKLTQSELLPRTSQPTPQEFEEVYRKLTENGDAVMSIHISSNLSGTCQSAELAKKSFHDADIEIIDTSLVSLALGLIVLAAARAAQRGAASNEIRDLVTRIIPEIRVFFLPATLKYLEKGGRIGKAQALLGSILDIKPICSFADGIVVPVEKVRTRGKGLARMIELLKEDMPDNSPLIIALVHANEPGLINELSQKVKANFNCRELLTSQIGPVVGTHGGPGIAGIMTIPAHYAEV